jgi:ABC-type transport system involved in cytochrome c biogenesis permease subunit
MIVGAIWAAQARVGYSAGDPRVQAMSLQDPKIFVALLCWLVYSFELFAARRIGWGGRRAAYLSALGFAIVLLNFVPISYFLTRSHNF